LNILAVFTSPLASAQEIKPAEFSVAPTGSDTNTGTADQPMSSPASAQREVRELRRVTTNSSPVRIIMRGGTYQLESAAVTL
jgi:hypothetical protein